MLKIILEHIDLIDPDRIVNFCLDHSKYQLLFDAIKPLKFKDGLDNCSKLKLIISMFNETVGRNQHQFALQVFSQYEGVILWNADEILPDIIDSLNEPFFMDVKLAIVKRVLPKIRFIHVDQLITKI